MAIEGEVIKKLGAPRKYEPWMGERIIEIAEQGGHVAEMCKAIEIRSKDTFYRWIKLYPEFEEAYKTAKLYSQAFYENLLLAVACGKVKNANFNAIAMTMNNKFGEDYSRGALGGGSNTEINIGSINSIERLDDKGLDAKIKALTKKLGIESQLEDAPAPDEEQKGN